MQLIFPRKNLALNTFISFRAAGTIFEFTEYLRKSPEERAGWVKDNLQFKVDHLYRLFDNLNEELNQTIHTSNNTTVNLYFEKLKEEIVHFSLLTIDKSYFIQISREWNVQKYNAFLEAVVAKEEEYFSLPERTKYAHLEKYNYTYYGFLSRRMETSENVNKNFYCVEEKPSLIDLDQLDNYLEILVTVTEQFKSRVSKEIALYDQNKLVEKNEGKSSSFYDNLVETIKNNKVAAVILIIFALYVGISEVVKITKENKEVLDSFSNKGIQNSHYELPAADLLSIKMDQISAVDFAPEPEMKNLTLIIKTIPKSKDKFVPLKSKGFFVLIDPRNNETRYSFDLNGDADGVKPAVISFLYLDGFLPKALFDEIIKKGNYKGKCIFIYDNDVYPGIENYISNVFPLNRETIKNL